MAKQLELISGKELFPSEQEGQSFLGKIGSGIARNIGRQAYNVGEAILSSGQRHLKAIELTGKALAQQGTPNQLANEMRGFKPEPQLKNKLIESGISEESLYPQNKYEEFLDALAQDLPIAAAVGGGTLLSRLGLSALGTAAGFGAKEAGFGPLGQAVAGIGIPFAVSSGRRFAQKHITKAVEDYKKNQYALAKEAIQGKKSAVPSLKEFIKKEQKQHSYVGSPEDLAIQKDLADFEAHITEGKMDLESLWERKKYYNAQYKKSHDPRLKAYYERAAGITSEELQKNAKQYTDFGIPFNEGEESHIALQKAEDAREYIKKRVTLDHAVKHPIASAIFFGIGKFKEKVPGYFSLLKNSPEAQRYAGKAIRAMFDKNVPVFINNAIKVENIIKNNEKNSAGKKKLEVIRGGIV